MGLTKFEFATICAFKAFLACYQDANEAPPSGPIQKRKNEPTDDSNGIPVCHVHGKAMRPSKFKEGQYYCGAKLDDDSYCKEKA